MEDTHGAQVSPQLGRGVLLRPRKGSQVRWPPWVRFFQFQEDAGNLDFFFFLVILLKYELQCCANLCCTESDAYTYIESYAYIIHTFIHRYTHHTHTAHILFHYDLSQAI